MKSRGTSGTQPQRQGDVQLLVDSSPSPITGFISFGASTGHLRVAALLPALNADDPFFPTSAKVNLQAPSGTTANRTITGSLYTVDDGLPLARALRGTSIAVASIPIIAPQVFTFGFYSASPLPPAQYCLVLEASSLLSHAIHWASGGEEASEINNAFSGATGAWTPDDPDTARLWWQLLGFLA